ncbi:surfactin synthase thioesterase subunit [Luteibacter rhizovicinus]|uniref:Surfactin synthase thioesterase subunit n=1 Tax=Luteibacter rhizovicinus TaxID=242606 RepID=A0A4R3YYI9_9GAMM|nr:thioesterase domain-containing protein [Luteibacter rhizovicinus]TCV97831.1 surfactin synthase thioesterase subunit [Luteibacter rhizovicinus]
MRTEVNHPGRWFRCFGASPAARRRLICFHHAGGGPSLFREWHKYCPPDTEVWAVAMPGREARIAEKPVDQMQALANMLVEALPLDLPFAFFGHSLGAVVGFELARQLHERRLAVPQHLFVSACPAPQLCRRDTSRAHLSDAELLRLLEGFGGTPKEILGHREYLDMVLSILRADFNLIDDYVVPNGCDVRFPITAYAGSRDVHVHPDRILAWDRWATHDLVCQRFDGDHFYLAEHREALIDDLFGRWRMNDVSKAPDVYA